MLELRLCLVITTVLACLAGSTKDTKKLLKSVDSMIVEGRTKYNDAVELLTQILEEEPDNFKALYKRAEVNDLLKNYKMSLTDLQHILEKNSGSKQSYQLRSKILTKTGDFDNAWQDWERLRQIYENSNSKYEKTKKYDEAVSKRDTLRTLSVEERKMDELLKAEPDNISYQRYCMEVTSRMMKEARERADEYRLKRVDCALAAKDYDVVNEELVRVLALNPYNLDAIHLKALSLKMMGATDAALSNAKRCLSLDPEHAQCKKLHKSIKTYNKLSKRFEDAVMDKEWDSILSVIDESFSAEANPFNSDRLYFYRCKAHLNKRMLSEGVNSCSAAIDDSGENNPGAWELHIMRADVHMLAGDLAQAEKDIERAAELQPNERSIMEKRARLEKLKKQAARKDYYKILFVSRTADTQEIKKAYRKLAMIHHPDKLAGDLSPEEIEKAEDLYKDISESYQVLSDKEKRRRYDLGEDIEDQPQNNHHHHQNFHFNQGGGFNFRFR
eukprot:TRINITY_DN3113_c0_g1_i1.p1 TRINITY_DN3113_c0_g1~~TRINITY_DN3113_c0_g1_i1.p1  ORF type:complete len:500 (+),score=111.53 TRINITY_DN3113_c0_g1_i1:41-1540(+)